MTTQIEALDQKRKRYRRGYVIWFIVFFTAWIIRSALKVFKVEADLLYSILLIVLLLCVLIQAYYALKAKSLDKEIGRDPFLKQALNDELAQLNELKAWKTAFFSVIGFIVIIALMSLFIDFNDMMLIFITCLLIGFGAYNTAIFVLNR